MSEFIYQMFSGGRPSTKRAMVLSMIELDSIFKNNKRKKELRKLKFEQEKLTEKLKEKLNTILKCHVKI